MIHRKESDGKLCLGLATRWALKTASHLLLVGNSKGPAELLFFLLVPTPVRSAFPTPDVGSYLTSVTSAKLLTLPCVQHTSKVNAAPPKKLALLAESFLPFLNLPEI